ncbi:hypothetical protein BX616_009312 [Lobosporangium transversale]|nr:hypothetical protein BX616_009312 [Lobosporangium transversale]
MVRSATNRANEQAVQTVRPLNNSNAPTDGFDEQDMMANPEVVRRMMMANPHTREVMENNPEVAQMLNDPSFLRQSMDMARNPKLMKQALRNNDRALSNLEMVPGGFNHLRRMYHSVQEPMEASRSMPEPSTDDLNAQFAARLNADTRPQAGQLNTTALPNPWAPPRNQSQPTRGSMFPGFGMGGSPSHGMTGFGALSPFGGLDSPTAGTPGSQPGNTGAHGFESPFGFMMNQRTNGSSQNQFGFPIFNNDGNLSPMGGNNPEMFQQMLQFQQMMRQMQQQQSTSSPPSYSGFPPFGNMWRNSNSNINNNSNTSSNINSTTPAANSATSTATTATTITPSATNTTATTNTIPNPSTTSTPGSTLPPPEERFQSQLASLRDMGFSDNQRNMRALLASGGDVNSAIEFLLRM